MGIEKRLIKRGHMTVVYTMDHPWMNEEHGDVSETAKTTVDVFDRGGGHIYSKDYVGDNFTDTVWRRLSRIYATNALDFMEEFIGDCKGSRHGRPLHAD